MPRNKDRLHLALYARPKHPGSYHYALFVCPKLSKHQPIAAGTKHHALNTLQVVAGEAKQPWRYERTATSIDSERYLLIHVVIAKVTSTEALDKFLEAVPVYQTHEQLPVGTPSFSCVTWVQVALEALKAQGAVTGAGEWDDIHRAAVESIEMEKENGRWKGGPSVSEVLMVDLLDGGKTGK